VLLSRGTSRAGRGGPGCRFGVARRSHKAVREKLRCGRCDGRPRRRERPGRVERAEFEQDLRHFRPHPQNGLSEAVGALCDSLTWRKRQRRRRPPRRLPFVQLESVVGPVEHACFHAEQQRAECPAALLRVLNFGSDVNAAASPRKGRPESGCRCSVIVLSARAVVSPSPSRLGRAVVGGSRPRSAAPVTPGAASRAALARPVTRDVRLAAQPPQFSPAPRRAADRPPSRVAIRRAFARTRCTGLPSS
jgi:hypothetical protein